MNSTKRSVTKTIATAMITVVVLSIVITSFSIITLLTSINDAEAINIAGSMRMQSYRLVNDIRTDSKDYSQPCPI